MATINIQKKFNYDCTNENSIMERARLLKGETLDTILKKSPLKQDIINPSNRGRVGNLIEKHWFGIENNSYAEPDFKTAGIELKVSPIKELKSTSLVVKERTKICRINYVELIKEEWISSHAKNKLNKILFIFYKHDFNEDNWGKQRVLEVKLWNLKTDELLISSEWFKTRDEVFKGNAHNLSESNYQILAPCTSGSGKDVLQPNNQIDARERSFALKQPFVNFLWDSINNLDDYESIQENLNLSTIDNLEFEVQSRINHYSGQTIGQIASRLNITIPSSKNAVRSIIMKLLGFHGNNMKIKEFKQLGVEIKVIPIERERKKLLESISFPAIKFKEFAKETWEDSSLSLDLTKILFIPVSKSKTSSADLRERVLEDSFFWSPSSNEMKIIKNEWLNYQKEVRKGIQIEKIPRNTKKGYIEQTSLPNESSTQIVHMRTHAKDSNDRDTDDFETSIVKHSFWLNKKFVNSLIENSSKK